MRARDICATLQEMGNQEKAGNMLRFFKTGPGEYGAGDIFAGIAVPELRRLGKEYEGLSLAETAKLLRSPLHEARQLALILLVDSYKKGDFDLQARVYDLYMENTRHINNWDLVDVSAAPIAGAHLQRRSRKPLYGLAKSPLLWDRRIAIVATFHYIKSGEFDDTLHIADLLLHDREDLMQKAVGWMLREVGKRDQGAEEGFLKPRCTVMPRTMLRYAIEKFPENLRQQYLRGEVQAR